jgi:hypothetical protein
LISPIRKNSDILDLSKFKDFFTPENFKEWFYELQKYRTQNPSECKILLRLREGDAEIDRVDENDIIFWEKFVLYFSFDFQGLKEKNGKKKAENLEREELSRFLEAEQFERPQRRVEGRGCYDCTRFQPNSEVSYIAGFCSYLKSNMTEPAVNSVLRQGCDGFELRERDEA